MLDTHKRRTADLRQTEAKLLHIKMKVLNKDDQTAAQEQQTPFERQRFQRRKTHLVYTTSTTVLI